MLPDDITLSVLSDVRQSKDRASSPVGDTTACRVILHHDLGPQQFDRAFDKAGRLEIESGSRKGRTRSVVVWTYMAGGPVGAVSYRLFSEPERTTQYRCRDARGRFVREVSVSDQDAGPGDSGERVYHYDENDRPIGIDHLEEGRQVATSKFEWNERDQLLRERRTGRSPIDIRFEWDRSGRLLEAGGVRFQKKWRRRYEYGPNGIVSVTVVRTGDEPQVLESNTFDAEGRIVKSTQLTITGQILRYEYDYDEQGREVRRRIYSAETNELTEEWSFAYASCVSRDELYSLFEG